MCFYLFEDVMMSVWFVLQISQGLIMLMDLVIEFMYMIIFKFCFCFCLFLRLEYGLFFFLQMEKLVNWKFLVLRWILQMQLMMIVRCYVCLKFWIGSKCFWYNFLIVYQQQRRKVQFVDKYKYVGIFFDRFCILFDFVVGCVDIVLGFINY